MATSNAKRKSPTENMSLILYDEVSGICPKCTKPLMKKSGRTMTKLFEIAHIFPNSPHPHEIELLKNEEILNDDVDHEDNLIALCRDCHKIFDNPRTVAGYQEMVALKKELQRLSRLKNGWFDSSIDLEINEVINTLISIDEDAIEELSLNAMKIESKADSTLESLVKLKIKSNIRYFYHIIKTKFADLDKITPYTSDTIYSQVKTYYIKLKKQGLNQTQIFSALTDWLKNSTSHKNSEAAEILVSYFVQNCEVYS